MVKWHKALTPNKANSQLLGQATNFNLLHSETSPLFTNRSIHRY